MSSDMLRNDTVYCLERFGGNIWWCIPEYFKSPADAEAYYWARCTVGMPYRIVKIETKTEVVWMSQQK
jgi:hypothetical protein